MADLVAGSSRPASIVAEMPAFQTNYITQADRTRAEELMLQQRVSDKKEKKTKKSEPFSYKEANPVLAQVVADKAKPASPGLVQALLEYGGNVSIARPKSKSLFKMVTRKDQKEVRSDLLSQATQNCGPEVVWILTTSADDTAKNEALPYAIQQNSATKALVLVNAGADAAPLCNEFLLAVDNLWEKMVDVLLVPRTKGPCQPCRDKGLVKAVTKGSMDIAKSLLDKGADGDFQSGAALQKALEAGREDLAVAITSCGKRPKPASLDLALDIAYVKLADDPEKQFRMIENCLKTGAMGSKTDETLVQTCLKGQNQLIDILLSNGASVDHNTGAALKFAITSKNPELLTTLLRGKPTNTTMAAVIPYTLSLDNIKDTHILIDILLSAGLRGDSVAETLIKVIENGLPGGDDASHLELIQLLLEKGEANVNLQDGRSIVLAVMQGRSNVLVQLLRHAPGVESLNNALPHALDIVDRALRLEIATMVLEAGARGKVVDEALVVSANSGKEGASLTSVILKQSSVDYDGGRPLVTATKSRCLEQMTALMVGTPSISTTAAAWAEVDAAEADDEFQLRAFEILLTGTVDVALQDKSLVDAATKGQRGLAVCGLLTKNQASPDRLEAASVVAAAKGLHLETLALLAKAVTLPATFVTAFDAFSEGDNWLQPRGLEIVHFILEHGASGPEVDAAFCKAARLYYPDALELLATSINPDVVNVALVLVTGSSDDWLSVDNRNLWLTHSLLQWGAWGESVNVAFLKAVDAYCRGLTSEQIIDTFLTVGSKADVNFQNGEALQIAIRYGNPHLLKKLATHGATVETIALAFAEAIIAVLEEPVIISLVESLTIKEVAKPDYNAPPEGYQQPLFACLAAHPKYAKLVGQLIKLGCNLEAEVDTFLYDDEELEPEPATVLAWALSQGMFIDSAAINALIDGKANINFVAKVSKTTVLILAAKNSRSDIVAKLTTLKANTSSRDRFDRSALFYASRIGNLDSVNALIKAKAPINDGSLQEAAKNLHYEVVAALIKGKHSPNFPSSKEQHQGRTALQEMCLKCDASNDITLVEETIKALMKGKPKVMEKSREKNALFLALDNAHPVPITKALLDSLMWEYINDKENVYVEVDPELGTRYFFSPTTYISRGFSQGPEKDNQKLLELLRDKRCEDRFYAEEGAEQPDGAKGIPAEIIDAEKKRKDHEEKLRKKEIEHQLKLLHAKQEADLKEEIDRSKHEEKMFREEEATQQKLDQKQQMHQQQLIQEAEKAAQKQNIMASTNDLKLAMQQQADAAKQRSIQARADFEEKQKIRMAQLKAAATQQENDLKLEFTQKANAQKLALQERQNRLTAAAGERKLLTAQRTAQLQAAEAQHKLAIKEKQDALAIKMAKGTAKQKKAAHDMKMKEMQAQSESMKLKMMDKYFASQPKNLKRITAA